VESHKGFVSLYVMYVSTEIFIQGKSQYALWRRAFVLKLHHWIFLFNAILPLYLISFFSSLESHQETNRQSERALA